jgi:hypothetical protein
VTSSVERLRAPRCETSSGNHTSVRG